MPMVSFRSLNTRQTVLHIYTRVSMVTVASDNLVITDILESL